MCKLRFCDRLIPGGRGKQESAQVETGAAESQGEVRRGREGGGNGGDGRVVELLRCMRRRNTGYPYLKAVRGRWLLVLMAG